MKKIIISLFLFSLAQPLFAGEQEKRKVFINQFIEHPALDMTVKGIVDGLAQHGYKAGVNLDLRIESAQGNPTLAAQIAAKFVNQEADVVIGIATIAAQSFIKYAKQNRTRLIFSSVTDPLKAGLVNDLNKPGNNISGVSNFVPIAPQLALFQKITPQLKKLGFLYNPSEINSLSLIEQLKPICVQKGITLVLQAANKTADMAQAATKLVSNSDAIFISNDSTALSALPIIINSANKEKIPVFVSDTDAVAAGAVAALGPNQYDIGLQTAELVVRALAGEGVGTIPIEFAKKSALYLNATAAALLNITFSEQLMAEATKIIK